METYKVTLTLTEPMLGTASSDKDIYKQYIAGRKLEEDKVALEPEKLAEELESLPDEPRPMTVFRRHDGALALTDTMLRGFLKEAAEAVSGIWGG